MDCTSRDTGGGADIYRCCCCSSSQRIPWLMMPYPVSPSDTTTRQFFCLSCSSSSSDTYHQLCLPQLKDTACHGLNHSGWILAICRGSKTCPFLFNPITLSQISLPPLPLPTTWKHCPHSDDDDREVEEEDRIFLLSSTCYIPSLFLAVLSSNPDDDDDHLFEIMVIHGWDRRLAFYRLGDAKWTAVVDRDCQLPCTKFVALTYWNGRFYAIDFQDNLVVCDTKASPPTASLLAPLPQRQKRDSRCYLVSSDQDLLLVIRSWENYKLINFHVFKFAEEETENQADRKKKEEEEEEEKERLHQQVEIQGGGGGGGEEEEEELWLMKMDAVEEDEKVMKEGKWLQMNTIGERAIFICPDNSLAISTIGVVECTQSCIYCYDIFTDNIYTGVQSYPDETSVKLIEFSLPKKKLNNLIHCSPPCSQPFWQPLFLLPSLESRGRQESERIRDILEDAAHRIP